MGLLADRLSTIQKLTSLAILSGSPASQLRQNFHVPLEAWRTAGEMFADFIVPFGNRMFRHLLQCRIGRTVNAMRVGKRFGQVRLGEAKEFVFVKFLSSVFWHLVAWPASTPRSWLPVSRSALISSTL
jgi:hypothetical protein